MNDYKIIFRKWLPLFILVIIVVTYFKSLEYIPDLLVSVFNAIDTFINLLVPFFIGALLAYILNIPCRKIENIIIKVNIPFVYKHVRAISVIITYLLVILIFYLTIDAVVPIIVSQITALGKSLQVYYEENLKEVISFYYEENLKDAISAYYESYLEDFIPNLDFSSTSSIAQITTPILNNILLYVKNIIEFSASLFKIFLSIVSSVYFLVYADDILKFLLRFIQTMFPKRVVGIFLKYGSQLNLYSYRYIHCQVIDGLILGIIVTIGLIAIGIDYAILFGLLLAILNFIPYFGSIFGTLLTILIIFCSEGITKTLVASLFLLIAQQLDANFIQPKLLGNSFKLNPVFIIISISIGGYYYGVLGMIAAIPVGAVLRNMLVDFMDFREYRR